ncbi:hypothetical protein BT69DRAFT_1250199 [Atractiella rhizophila]|nr:hypothetical protein BT69DRAFT_1250199 [Atractiella rhizophila]
MWCDNCLLIFPLRHGAIALASFVGLYSLIGGILLFLYGAFWYFTFPEPQIYGGIAMAILALCVTSGIGISNNSLLWLRFSFYLWPFVIVVNSVRAGLMVWRVNYYQGRVIWECNHGGVKWTQAAQDAAANNTLSDNGQSTLPSSFCNSGFHNFYIALTFSLVVDWILQVYLYFLVWRCMRRVQHYLSFQRDKYGVGVYTA